MGIILKTIFTHIRGLCTSAGLRVRSEDEGAGRNHVGELLTRAGEQNKWLGYANIAISFPNDDQERYVWMYCWLGSEHRNFNQNDNIYLSIQSDKEYDPKNQPPFWRQNNHAHIPLSDPLLITKILGFVNTHCGTSIKDA